MQLLSICTQEYMDVNLFNFIFHQFLKSSFHLHLSRAFLIIGIFPSPRPSWWYSGNHSNSSFTNPPPTDQLTVTWTPPTTGGVPTSYNVTINDSSSPVVIADNGSSVYTHTFTGLVSDTLYTVSVVAINCGWLQQWDIREQLDLYVATHTPHIGLCMHSCQGSSLHVLTQTHTTNIHRYTQTHICKHIHVYIHMYTHMHTHTHAHIHTPVMLTCIH